MSRSTPIALMFRYAMFCSVPLVCRSLFSRSAVFHQRGLYVWSPPQSPRTVQSSNSTSEVPQFPWVMENGVWKPMFFIALAIVLIGQFASRRRKEG